MQLYGGVLQSVSYIPAAGAKPIPVKQDYVPCKTSLLLCLALRSLAFHDNRQRDICAMTCFQQSFRIGR
jgi:hypothetical protein